MRTTNEIVKFVDGLIEAMLKRPLMWAADPVSFESMMLTHMNIYAFALGKDNTFRMNDRWAKYAHEFVGDIGSLTVASHLKKSGALNDNWSMLASILNGFYTKEIKKLSTNK